MEVWNKVDLVEDDKTEAFKEKVEKASQEADFPIVIMSAKTGYNKDLFLE
jgi:50S ribosomal subunit-associated GTPase HflX